MKEDEGLQEARRALSKMIADRALKGGKESFAEIERISVVAQELERAVGKRVEDFDDPYEDDDGNFLLPRRRGNRRRARMVNVGAPIGDTNEMARELMMHVSQFITKDAAKDDASELASLLRLPEAHQKDVAERIALLKDRIKRREADEVVPAVVLRRHPSGEGFEGKDPPRLGQAHPDREGGNEDAPGDGLGAPLAQDPLV